MLTFKNLLIGFLLVIGLNAYAQDFKAMSYNIRYASPNDGENIWDKRKDELIKTLQYYQPDFLGIQEGLLHQVNYITEHVNSYKMIGVARDDGQNKGEFSAIFYNASRFTLLESHTFWLSETQEVGSKGWDAALPRIYTYGHFKDKKTGKKLWVFNTHFDHMGLQARTNSAKLLLETIQKVNTKNEPVVLMGDLNSTPETEAISTLNSGLTDTYSEVQSYGPLGTFTGFDKDLLLENRIDYIYCKNLKVLSHRHIDDRRPDGFFISDHLPVMVEFSYP